MFLELCSDIENCQVFKIDPLEEELCESAEELAYLQNEVNESNNILSTFDNYRLLYQNGKIVWHSDDFDYDEANSFSIEKQEDQFVIQFQLKDNDYFIRSIRIRNSGSRYDPFNMIFMNMYNKLQEYDSNYHQVNIEEYLYQKKKLKSTKRN